jgi:hypothetical protein
MWTYYIALLLIGCSQLAQSTKIEPSMLQPPVGTKVICQDPHKEGSATVSQSAYFRCVNEAVLRISKATLNIANPNACPNEFTNSASPATCSSGTFINSDVTSNLVSLCNTKTECLFQFSEFSQLSCIATQSKSLNNSFITVPNVKIGGNPPGPVKFPQGTVFSEGLVSVGGSEIVFANFFTPSGGSNDGQLFIIPVPLASPTSLHPEVQAFLKADGTLELESVPGHTQIVTPAASVLFTPATNTQVQVVNPIPLNVQSMSVVYQCEPPRARFRPFGNKRFNYKFRPTLNHADRKLSMNHRIALPPLPVPVVPVGPIAPPPPPPSRY